MGTMVARSTALLIAISCVAFLVQTEATETQDLSAASANGAFLQRLRGEFGAQMLGEADDATPAASQAADKLPAVIAEKQNEAQAAQKIAEERSSKARLANDHASELAKDIAKDGAAVSGSNSMAKSQEKAAAKEQESAETAQTQANTDLKVAQENAEKNPTPSNVRDVKIQKKIEAATKEKVKTANVDMAKAQAKEEGAKKQKAALTRAAATGAAEAAPVVAAAAA